MRKVEGEVKDKTIVPIVIHCNALRTRTTTREKVNESRRKLIALIICEVKPYVAGQWQQQCENNSLTKMIEMVKILILK